MSPESREKLSKLAKERHAAGKFGGSEFGKMGGRPRKDRAATRVAEAAQEEANARKIINVFKDAVHEAQPLGIRLKGAELWLNVEKEDAKVSMQQEASQQKQRSREELLEVLSQKLTAGPAAEILHRELEKKTEEPIVDAEVVEDVIS